MNENTRHRKEGTLAMTRTGRCGSRKTNQREDREREEIRE